MADCNETLRELEQFLDNELSDGARHAIQHHLNGCLDCLSAFDFHAELRTVISLKLRSDTMPDGLLGRIEACFGGVEPTRPAFTEPAAEPPGST